MVRGDQQVRAAAHGGPAGAVPQRVARAVQGDERGRAGRVHGHARAPQVEGVGEAVGGQRRGAAGHRVRADGPLCHQLERPVGRVGDPDVDGRVRAGEQPGVDGGVVQRLRGQLQQQPVLRVHLLGLGGRDTEVGGVEGGDVREEAPGGRVALARSRHARVHEALRLEPVGRRLADQVAPVRQRRPQLAERVDPAGQSAGGPDHGDGPAGPRVALLHRASSRQFHVGSTSVPRRFRVGFPLIPTEVLSFFSSERRWRRTPARATARGRTVVVDCRQERLKPLITGECPRNTEQGEKGRIRARSLVRVVSGTPCRARQARPPGPDTGVGTGSPGVRAVAMVIGSGGIRRPGPAEAATR